jgi:transcriptional regulator with XRE-family HTH domain
MMSADQHGPILGRRRLSAALRHARDQRGWTQEQVAAAMDWSLSKLIRIEKGTVGISTTDLRSLLAHYGVHDSERVNGLVRLAKASRERPWWAQYREHLPSADFEKLLGLEAEASTIETFQSNLIPGLLQTQQYMHYVLGGITHEMESSESVNVREDVRLRRQQAVLHSEEPPLFKAVLDEATLRRVADNGPVMRQQLLHLADLCTRPNIVVEVIPFTAGPYVDSGTFAILSFAGSVDPPVVYLENAWYDMLMDREDQVSKYKQLLDLLRRRALDPAESENLIRKIADEFR